MKDIEKVFKNYIKAIYSNDYKTFYSLLDENDAQAYKDKMISFAYKMDEFGEAQGFINALGYKTLKELKDLSLNNFIISIFKLSAREIGAEDLKKILSELSITKVDENDTFSNVSYQYPINIFGEWEMYNGDVQMSYNNGEWKIFFKSGLDAGLSRFQDDIDKYFERKSKDKLDNLGFEGDLTKVSIIGYKDSSSGKMIFEPRFKDAGDFSDGLAYVQVMSKYGYLNLKGELQIKPQYYEAKDFSNKLAAVKMDDENGEKLWGFINRKGKVIIEAQYTDTNNFDKKLCAVEINGKWGFIDKKGIFIVPSIFDSVDDFYYGKASAYKDDVNDVEFIINNKGNIKEIKIEY